MPLRSVQLSFAFRLANISCPTVDQQMRADAPSPSCPREIKIAGTMVQLERLIGMRDIHICVTRESIEIQVLSRGNVVTQFKIAVIERNIGEVAAQSIAY